MKLRHRQNALDLANQLIAHDRNQTYGTPKENFDHTAALWTVWVQARYGDELYIQFDATDVAVMMDLVKTARLAKSPDHADTWVDKCGYSACGYEVSDDD